PPDRARLQAEAGDKLVFQDGSFNVTNFLTFNTKKPPFDDERVRRALLLAIDRNLGVEVLSEMTTIRSQHTCLPVSSEYAIPQEEYSSLPGFGGDIEAARAEARRLLEEAGVPNLEFKLLGRNLRQPWEPLGIFVADQLSQIGVKP